MFMHDELSRYGSRNAISRPVYVYSFGGENSVQPPGDFEHLLRSLLHKFTHRTSSDGFRTIYVQRATVSQPLETTR